MTEELNLLPKKKKRSPKPDPILSYEARLTTSKTGNPVKRVTIFIDRDITDPITARRYGNWLLEAANWLEDQNAKSQEQQPRKNFRAATFKANRSRMA